MDRKVVLAKWAVFFVVAFGFVGPKTLYADSSIGEISFKNCKVSDPTGKLQVKAECATLSVPENYAKPDGKKIELHIARFKAKSDKRREDALTLLAGGPGQGAIESFAPYIPRLKKLNTDQDIYLIDQRGTGKSSPMNCDLPEDDPNASNEFDAALVTKLTKECLAKLKGDPAFYTTSVAMKDLDVVRQALGIKQWNLYGGSYGTRTAQHYLKQYPKHVRTIILDGVIAPSRPLGPEISTESQKSLDELLARCKKDTDCNKAFPNLTAETNRIIAELKIEPKKVTIENLSTGKLEPMSFTISHLAGGIRMALYSPRTMSILPILLHEAAVNNHYGPLARQSLNTVRNLSSVISTGMHNSVVCTEDAPLAKQVKVDAVLLARSYMGSDFQKHIDTVCGLWPKGPMDDGFHELVATDVPVLLLSGGQDPVTPPEYAEEAMQKMTKSKHIVVPGQGHIQMGSGCMPTILAKFVSTASVEKLQTKCLDKIKPEPFFIDFNGPTP